MNINEIIASDRVWLTAADIAPVLGTDPQTIRNQAHANPALLGYPVIVAGNRVRIPRVPFLRHLGLAEESFPDHQSMMP